MDISLALSTILLVSLLRGPLQTVAGQENETDKELRNIQNDENVEVFKSDPNGQKSEDYYYGQRGYSSRYWPYLYYRYKSSSRDRTRNVIRKSKNNSKYPRCSYKDTSFINFDRVLLNSLVTDSLYECKQDCRATEGCKFWTYDEEARTEEENCFLTDSGIGRTPNEVFVDEGYISGTRRNNCKCLRRTDIVDGEIDEVNNRRRRRRRRRSKICPVGYSDDVDELLDDFDEFNEPLTGTDKPEE